MRAPVLVRVVLALSLAAATVPAGHARAEPPTKALAAAKPSEEQKARALAKYEEGSRAFAQRRFKDAVDLFLEADSIAQSPAFAYNIGLAYQGMNDDANTLRWLREYLRRDPHASDRDTVAPLIRRHEQRLAAKGVQQLTVLSEPAGATLLIDGQPKGITPWTGELAPGRHALQLQLRRYLDAEQSVDLAVEHAEEVSVELSAAPALRAPGKSPAPLGPPPEADTTTASSSSEPMLVAGAVALGLGAVGGGVGIGLEMARRHAEDDARLAATQLEAMRHIERTDDLRAGARVAVGLGVGFGAVGIVMIAVGIAQGEDHDEAAQLELGCDPRACGATLRGRF